MQTAERKAQTADANDGLTDREIGTARRLVGSSRDERHADGQTATASANGVNGPDHNGRITL